MFVSRFLISLASELREKNIYPFSYSSPLHMLSIWFFMKITARVKQMAAVSPHEEPRIRGFLTRLAVLFGTVHHVCTVSHSLSGEETHTSTLV